MTGVGGGGVGVGMWVCLNDSPLKAEILCLKKKCFLSQRITFYEADLGNWIAKK